MMARFHLRYVKSDIDRHGNARYYFRRRDASRKIRLPGLPGSKEFMAAYQDCLSGKDERGQPASAKPSEHTTMRWLCIQYAGSAEFKRLDATVQKRRRMVLEAICSELTKDSPPQLVGNQPYASIPPRAIRALRDRKLDAPGAANNWLRAMKALFKWAVEADLLTSNPARDVPKVTTVTEGFHSWTVEEVHKFEECHPIGSTARLAFALLLYTGQRRSDVVLFGRQHVKDGRLKFTQHKNRNRKPVTLELPILSDLQAVIDATPSPNLTFLTNAYGKPFSSGGFGNRFREWCDMAGLPHCSAHGLRKAGACIAAENGATPSQLMAIFGWRDIGQAEHYTRAANQRKLADGSMHLLRQKSDKA